MHALKTYNQKKAFGTCARLVGKSRLTRGKALALERLLFWLYVADTLTGSACLHLCHLACRRDISNSNYVTLCRQTKITHKYKICNSVKVQRGEIFSATAIFLGMKQPYLIWQATLGYDGFFFKSAGTSPYCLIILARRLPGFLRANFKSAKPITA